MIRHINQPVSIVMVLDASARQALPRRVKWEDRDYDVVEVGFRHTVRKGTRRIHIFSLNVGSLDMRIEIDGDSLAATLAEVSDGLAD